jgi:hypothetical protein
MPGSHAASPVLLLAALLVVLSGCEVTVFKGREAKAPMIEACDPAKGPCPDVLTPDENTVRPQHRKGSTVVTGESFVEGRTVADVDQTTSAEKAAARSTGSSAEERELGRTVATLGDVGEQGFWLKTPLVLAKTEGRVVWASNGNAVKVTLIPRPGTGGSQISLAAMRALGVPLTALAELIVFANQGQ